MNTFGQHRSLRQPSRPRADRPGGVGHAGALRLGQARDRAFRRERLRHRPHGLLWRGARPAPPAPHRTKDSSSTARSPTRQRCCNRRCCRITKARSGTNRTARKRRAAGRSTASIRRATAGCSSRHATDELARCAELADLAGRSGADLERALEERMRSRSVAEWVEALDQGRHRRPPRRAEPAPS